MTERQAPSDVLPYLGMGGHAAFVKSDGTVFAHTHPEGTVPMPAVDLAMPDMPCASATISLQVRFPYGFLTPETYRIFVQMKHGTAVRSASLTPPFNKEPVLDRAI